MRIAVLSDIHSNVYALEAIIADLEFQDIEVKVNLGDILYGPIAPRATYDLLMEYEFITIQGNQDRQVYEATEEEIANNPTLQFIRNDLGFEPTEWMRNLPTTYQLSPSVFLCHGTPSDDTTYLLENVESGYAILREDQEIIELLGDQHSQVILCGHTHTSRAVKLSNNQFVFNPGSVGLPAYADQLPNLHRIESYSPQASYGIVDVSSRTVKFQHIKVSYDHEKAAIEAKRRHRDDWAHYLKTGRARLEVDNS